MVFLPKVLAFFLESQTFGKSLKTFGLDFFLRFFKFTGWYGFSNGFFVVLNAVLFKIHKSCFIKDTFRSIFVSKDGVL